MINCVDLWCYALSRISIHPSVVPRLRVIGEVFFFPLEPRVQPKVRLSVCMSVALTVKLALFLKMTCI